MTVGASVLNAASAVYTRIWEEKYKTAAPGAWKALVWEATVKGKVGNYPYSKYSAKLQEFKGEVEFRRAAMGSIQVIDKTWSDGLAIPDQILEDDELELMRGDIEDLAVEAQRYKEELATAALLLGFTTAGPDGATFFSNAHPREGGLSNQDNDLGAVALNATNFNDARMRLELFTDPTGRPRGYEATHLVYGPQNQAAVEALVDAQFGSSGASNTLYKKATPIKLRYITGKQWFVMDGTWSKRKPLLWQTRREAKMTPPAPNSDHAQKYLEHLYALTARYNVALFDALCIVGSEGA